MQPASARQTTRRHLPWARPTTCDQIYVESARGPSACGELATFYPEMVAPGWTSARPISTAHTKQTAAPLWPLPTSPERWPCCGVRIPNLTVAQQEAALLNGAVDLGSPGPDNTFGQGRLDVLAAYGWLDRVYPTVDHKAWTAPTRLAAGATLTYTLAITNAGPSAASVVTVNRRVAGWGDVWRRLGRWLELQPRRGQR